MKLNVFNAFVAEGEPADLAMFLFVLICGLQQKTDDDKKKEVDEWLKKYGDKTFEELMRMERDEEE